ncbi:hypothetical protein L5515_015846 [Caenorhabditis briggsae]|uniref:C-type LECtin n=1 Tax=Caenorhabditis briggsae TaxID=6238 RepID=A0AAE9J9A4_CAEBR|nr:hypothetical protein L5515_015846 [Caenorhabditis briggsae]
MIPLLLLFLLLPSTFCLICPKEYYLVNDSKCLKAVWTRATHSDAESNCTASGGTLVNIKNAIDNHAVFNFGNTAGLDSIWIGLSCFGNTTSSCFWDDASGSAASYSNFDSFGPNQAGDRNCVRMAVSTESVTMGNSGRWSSSNCGNNFAMYSSGYICEAPPTLNANPYNSMTPACNYNYNRKCYMRSNDYGAVYYKQSAANNYCLMMGYTGGLASIHSKIDVDFIRNLYKGTNTTHVYIGAMAETADRFNWIDGTAWDFNYMDPLNFQKAKCLVMDVQWDGLWSPMDCDQQLPFLCGRKILEYLPALVPEAKFQEPNVLDASNCNSTLLLAPGSISSFGYPGTPSGTCIWQIRALGPYRLGIYFDLWATLGSLSIYDEFGTNIGNVFGSYNTPPFAKYTPFNIAKIVYEARRNPDPNDRGFHAVIMMI